MAEAHGAGKLSKIFSKVVVGGALALAGAIMLEPLVLYLGHFDPGGVSVMAALSPVFESFFESFGITDALLGLGEWISEFTLPPADLAAGAGAVASGPATTASGAAAPVFF